MSSSGAASPANVDDNDDDHSAGPFDKAAALPSGKDLPMSASSSQGGVKGVLKDAKLHQAHQMEERRRLENERAQYLHRQVHGSQLPAEESVPSVSLAYEAEMRLRALKLERRRSSSSASSSSDFSDEEGDDDIMNEYRMQRMKSMHQQQTEQMPQKHKAFGKVLDVTKEEFVDVVDREAETNTPVVVHLYEDCVPECRHLNECLAELARTELVS
jgi:hypothetical protein